jgi:hypothetical protein
MVKSTYVLDLESVDALGRLARDWQVSKSEVLRRVLKNAVASPAPDRVALFRQMQKAAGVSAAKADRWVAAVRAERRASTLRPEGKRR